MNEPKADSASPRGWRQLNRPLLLGVLACIMIGVPGLFARYPSPVVGTVSRGRQPLLVDGGFEEDSPLWVLSGKSVRAEAGAGRGGSRGVVVESPGEPAVATISQTMRVKSRSVAAPILVRGWSRAEEVDGAPDEGYSIYVDLEYADGTTLFGQAAAFACGTHDFEERQVLIPVTRPVRTVTVHCLFRGHRGKVWFDDITVEERVPDGDAVVFQGVPVRMKTAPRHPKKSVEYATADGLKVSMAEGAVSSLKLDTDDFVGSAPSGFLVRDAAADSDFFRLRNGACEELALKVESRIEAKPDHIEVSGKVSSTEARDRALTLVFALPIEARGWRWGQHIGADLPVTDAVEYANTVPVPCGATGTLSRYPLAALSLGRLGLGLATDPALPSQSRLSYHGGTRQFMVAYDFGLLGDGVAGGEFRFMIYRFDGRWGFRSALEKYYSLFPGAFAARTRVHGIWMPFGDVSKIADWADFGFRFHEGDSNPVFDDAQGILTFRYSEPLLWWMPLGPKVPRTLADAARERAARARLPDGLEARGVESAGMAADDGTRRFRFRSEPWCDGAAWSMNPNPRIPGSPYAEILQRKEQEHSGEAHPKVDGEFLDSVEGYAAAELDFDREHVRHASAPPTFSLESKQPVVFKGQAMFEYARDLRARLQPRGRFLFGNGVPHRFGFLCSLLDVMGTEVNWLKDGAFHPSPHEDLALWRSLSGQKPYLLLLNTDFDAFTPAMTEAYFQRCLFYGIFPSMFSRNASDRPYWENREWYDRDRPLFKKYVPLIRRLAVAGWQPVTGASTDAPGLLMERFGPDASGTVYLTVLNEGDRPWEGGIALEPWLIQSMADRSGGTPGSVEMRETFSGKSLEAEGNRVPARLKPGELWMLELRPPGKR